MDSFSSTSSSSQHTRFRPIQPVADRILRALRHRLLLLHRSESTFFILGATGNVYTVILSTIPSCSCPDRTTPCKHILFVFIKVLGVSLEDMCLRKKMLRPCQLDHLINKPTLSESFANETLRHVFRELYFKQGQDKMNIATITTMIEPREGAMCPICLDDVTAKGNKVVACGTCRNVIHEKCLLMWKKSQGRRPTSCVICRARWRDAARAEDDKYLNLTVYMNEDNAATHNGIASVCNG